MNYLNAVPRIILCTSVFFFTCGGPKVLIPPRIDLKPYGPIGMIQLGSNAKGNLADYTSQRVLRTLQDAQPGVPVVELGSQSSVLGAVGRSQLDVEAIKLICAKYGVGGVLWGNLQVEKVKPAVNISSFLSSLTVSAYVEANLSLKFVESRAGATVWSDAAQGRENVASVSLMKGDTWFNAKDPEKAYGSLVRHLVSNVTGDFWSHWQ